MNREKDTAQKVWAQYEAGKNYFEKQGYYEVCEQSWNFYAGDQWSGLKTAGEKPPALNVLSPIADFKIATVAQNGVNINYSSLNYGSDFTDCAALCGLLNTYAAKTWERLKFDRVMWEALTEAAVTGESFLYFYDDGGKIASSAVDTTNVYLADEQESDIQKQRYIIIAQRLLCDEVKRMALASGISAEEAEAVRSDGDTSRQLGEAAKEEIKADGDGGKCLCLLKMWKENGAVHYLRCTKDLIYVPEREISGLKLYPLAHMSWIKQKGFSRGGGEIYRRIPNQIEINKALARYLAVIKQCAYPHVVYNKEVVRGAADLNRLINTVGSVIGLDSPKMQKISDVITYLKPGEINPAAINAVYELEEKTRELAGAGEASLGAINPENASGAAIIAVRDAAALPLNNQQAAYKQFIEDIALIWFEMWAAYNPSGLTVADGENVSVISAQEIARLKIEVKIDISPANPYSRYAQEQTLQNLLSGGYISFEEYVMSLPEGCAAPKEKLKAIIDMRAEQTQTEESFLAEDSAPEEEPVDEIRAIAEEAYNSGKTPAQAAKMIRERLNYGI